jgi:hypothetical protein
VVDGVAFPSLRSQTKPAAFHEEARRSTIQDHLLPVDAGQCLFEFSPTFVHTRIRFCFHMLFFSRPP